MATTAFHARAARGASASASREQLAARRGHLTSHCRFSPRIIDTSGEAEFLTELATAGSISLARAQQPAGGPRI